MKLVQGKPPIYNKLIEAGLKPNERTVFTFGDTLFIQDLQEKDIDQFLLAHEKVHQRQQKNPHDWWNRYISDPKFRFEQELEAYREQYIFFKANMRTKYHKDFLFRIARDLSSPIYGCGISYIEAENLIRKV